MPMDDITSKHIFVFPLVCLGVSFFEAMDPHTVSLIPSGQGLIHLYGNDTKILVHSQNVQCRTCQYMEVVGCWVRKAGFCKGGGELLSLSMSSFSDNFCCKILQTIVNFFFKFFPYPAKHRIPISFSFMFLSNCHSMYRAPNKIQRTLSRFIPRLWHCRILLPTVIIVTKN